MPVRLGVGAVVSFTMLLPVLRSQADDRVDLPLGWIDTVAGRVVEGADGASIDLASLGTVAETIAIQDNGTVAFTARSQILSVDREREIHRLAGTGLPADTGDGPISEAGGALETGLQDIKRIAFQPAGSISITEAPIINEDGPSATGLRALRMRSLADGRLHSEPDLALGACPRLPASITNAGRPCVLEDAVYGADGSLYVKFSTSRLNTMLAVRRPGQSALTHLAGNGEQLVGRDGPAWDDVNEGGSATGVNLRVDLDAFVGDEQGNAFIASGQRIFMITRDGRIFARYGSNATDITGDGGPAAGAGLGRVTRLARDRSGSLLLASECVDDCGKVSVRRIDVLTGLITTVAGTGSSATDGAPASATLFEEVAALAVSPDGAVVSVMTGATDENGIRRVSIRRFRLDGTVETVVGAKGGTGYLAGARVPRVGTRVPENPGMAVAPGGEFIDVVALDGSDRVPTRIDAGGDQNALLNATSDWKSIAVDRDGTTFIGRTAAGAVQVEVLTADGATTSVQLLAGSDEAVDGLAIGPRGTVYALAAGQLFQLTRTARGRQARSVASGFDGARAIAVGADDTVYLTEPERARVLERRSDGSVRSFAGTGKFGFGGDEGAAADAQLATPTSVAVGPDGSVFIADLYGSRVRQVTPDGIIHSVAGDGTYTGTTGRGPALGPAFIAPVSVAVDDAGTVYVLDVGAFRIRHFVPGVGLAPAAADVLPPARFVALDPTRIADTRLERAEPLPGGSTYEVTLGNRPSLALPPDATSVVLNVTLTDSVAPGYVQVLPTGRGAIGASSSLNIESRGQTKANLVTVPLGDRAAVTLYTQGGGHFVVDLLGYYVTVKAATSAGRFVSLEPIRVLDTREGRGQLQRHRPTAGESVTLALLGVGGVPASGVDAVVFNLTATEAVAPGFVQVLPTGRPELLGRSSSLNVERPDQTIANLVLTTIGSAGLVDIFTQSGTELVVDVVGYYTGADAPAGTSGLYQALDAPVRVVDTRSGSAPPLAPRSQVSFDATLASPAYGAFTGNLTATEAVAPGYVQLLPTGPATVGSSSSLNVDHSDQTIANAVQIAVGEGGYASLFTQSGAHLVVDVAGWFLAA